ncbi:MAG: SDR family NAD(P)-dependent oxidoreductase, partial [Candidatus Eremiobacteraeota bacterium]|nr:SDR family NAD(P)-dependent oxidoreductase [Candidatus Eremiobacteraeota bacterium]
MAEDVSGRTALVTGASRGIGAAIARSLAAVGCRVVLTYRSREAEALAVVSEIEASGGSAFAIRCDVNERAALRELAGRVCERYDRLDILVNNAGIAVRRELDDITEADWDAHHETNVTPAFVLS